MSQISILFYTLKWIKIKDIVKYNTMEIIYKTKKIIINTWNQTTLCTIWKIMCISVCGVRMWNNKDMVSKLIQMLHNLKKYIQTKKFWNIY